MNDYLNHSGDGQSELAESERIRKQQHQQLLLLSSPEKREEVRPVQQVQQVQPVQQGNSSNNNSNNDNEMENLRVGGYYIFHCIMIADMVFSLIMSSYKSLDSVKIKFNLPEVGNQQRSFNIPSVHQLSFSF